MDLVFEWDEAKALTNQQKHGVSFAEAQTVFLDPMHLTIFDEAHSHIEDRFITIGRSVRDRILVVVHTERDDRIRIISSRGATPMEQRQYEYGTDE